MNSPPEDRLLLVWLGSGTQTGSSPPRASAPTLRGERPEIQPEKVEDNRAARTGKNQSGRNGGARDIQMYSVQREEVRSVQGTEGQIDPVGTRSLCMGIDHITRRSTIPILHLSPSLPSPPFRPFSSPLGCCSPPAQPYTYSEYTIFSTARVPNDEATDHAKHP